MSVARTLQVRVPGDLADEIDRRAQETGLSKSETLRMILEIGVQRTEDAQYRQIFISAAKQGVLRGIAHTNQRLQAVFHELLAEAESAS